MADAQILPRTSPVPTDEDDEGRLAHIGRAAEVNRAYVTGETITALCGKRFVPTRDPERYPVCPRCAQVLARLKSGRAGLN